MKCDYNNQGEDIRINSHLRYLDKNSFGYHFSLYESSNFGLKVLFDLKMLEFVIIFFPLTNYQLLVLYRD